MKETERWQSKQKAKAVLEGVSLLWGNAYLGQPSACLFKRQAPGRVSLCDSGIRGGLAPLISWLCPYQVKAMFTALTEEVMATLPARTAPSLTLPKSQIL